MTWGCSLTGADFRGVASRNGAELLDTASQCEVLNFHTNVKTVRLWCEVWNMQGSSGTWRYSVYNSASADGGPRSLFRGVGGSPQFFSLIGILIFLWVRSPCKISKPYDKPFWEKRKGRERRKKTALTVVTKPSAHRRSEQFLNRKSHIYLLALSIFLVYMTVPALFHTHYVHVKSSCSQSLATTTYYQQASSCSLIDFSSTYCTLAATTPILASSPFKAI